MLLRQAIVSMLLLLSAVGAVNAQQSTKMTNADVMGLASAGLGDDIIIAKIHAAPATAFDTSVDGLKSLQAAHMSALVIRTMIDPHATPAASATPAPAAMGTPTAPAGDPNDPTAAHSPGIYIYSSEGGKPTMVELQHVTPKGTKSGGFLASHFTYGIAKHTMKGVLDGAHAPVKTADTNPVFYLYALQYAGGFGGSAISPSDFTLVAFTPKNGNREIVEASGNIFGGKTGTDDKARRGFSVDQVKPGIYKLTLAQAIAPGEYAFAQNTYMFFDFEITPPESQNP